MSSAYQQLRIQRVMLRDEVRCKVFREAIAHAVRPGDVVLDIGAGTGLLSLFGLQAGAARVYAVERSGIADFARQLVAYNRGERRIEVIYGTAESIVLPEQVDVIVSEWMGGYGVDENMLAPVLVARDRWLKKGGIMVPEHVTAWMAPVFDEVIHAELAFFRSNPYDLDLSLVATTTTEEMFFPHHHVLPQTLVAPPQQLWATNVYTCTLSEAQQPFRAEICFDVPAHSPANALATWFEARFSSGAILTTAPDAPATHWGRWVFPLQETVDVEPGTPIRVCFTCELNTAPGWSHANWWVRIGEGSWEYHDTKRAIW